MSKKLFFRVTALMVSLLLAVSLLAACNKDDDASKDTTTTREAGDSNNGAKSSKIVDEPLTLTYWVRGNNIEDPEKGYNTITCYQELEKRTGINIKWISAPKGSDQEQFNLMLASNELPDMIEAYWDIFIPSGEDKAYEDGVIIKLNDYIDQYAPNLKSIIDSNPNVLKQMTSDAGGGNIYYFPWLTLDDSSRVYYGLIIRDDWLKALGLEYPETIEQWETVLRKFKDSDPNKNEKADEIPLTFYTTTEALHEVRRSGAFIGAYGIDKNFYVKDGKVKYGSMEPEYKQFLELFRKWYVDGLIDQDFISQDKAAFEAKLTGNRVGAYIGWLSNLMKYTDLMEDTAGLAWEPVQHPVINKGEVPKFGQISHEVNSPTVCVTTQSKYPVECVKWLDYKYGDEGHMLMNFGIKKETYNMVDGKPVFTDNIMKNPEGTIEEMMKKHVQIFPGPMINDGQQFMQLRLAMESQRRASKVWSMPTHENLLPPISFNPDESTEMSAKMNEIKTYGAEMLAKFILGKEPLDKYDSYVAQLKSMGIEDVLSIYQASYERYMSR